ncbi:DNA methyltransferase [Tissierella carlieri]|uniref:site-specific DNA-methyltransferase (cytosine-N(4)-specific) n=1 Tax=Tissierella carlieri TaxID=689904 RepID=A0ABT1S4W5_9FIRM|nr:DNA methyltransferase [Tissierella carlieri]MCQ4921508.1 DNA methyltransferase [Tissierella carlieri]
MLNSKDKQIINLIEERMNIDSSFWDFKDDYKKEHIHNIFTYPATMVPKMQSEILDIISSIDDDINNILDPFMGSGTILVEGMLRGLNIYGIDINPLAYLITSVKINPVSIELLKSKTKDLFIRIDSNNTCDIHSFNNINKWFKSDIINDLSIIRSAITHEENVSIRNIFWVAFAEIVRMSSNSRKSTFKLHIKNAEDIKKFNYKAIDSFKNQMLDTIGSMELFLDLNRPNFTFTKKSVCYNGKQKIYYGDTNIFLNDGRRFKRNSIDLIITSPPYGDNHTTVTYGQYSYLPLSWINFKDINKDVNSEIIQTQTTIDKVSLGGINYTCQEIEMSNILDHSDTLSNIYYKIINDNEYDKARKVASFYLDFFKSLSSMSKILKPNKYAIFTIGNRRVNNELIEFNKILDELSKSTNMVLIYDFRRNILNKRMANKISRSKCNKPIKSMKEENVLIFRKIK